jgi:hypothetical protein
MFAKTIIDSDAFLDMPLSSQALYFHLSMRADDDGFINNPMKIQRMIGSSVDDLRLLITKNFVIPFESGVVVIKHWKIHNYIQKDRYKETVYQEEKSLLTVKENMAYTKSGESETTVGFCLDTGCIQPGHKLDTQVRLGKDSIGKVSVGKEIEGDVPDKNVGNTSRSKRFVPPTVEEVKAYCLERGNCVDPQRFVDYYSSNGWMVGKNKMNDWKAAVRTWEQREKPQAQGKAKSSNPFLDMLAEGDYE